jgi:ATP-binding cassette subfamily F protein 3
VREKQNRLELLQSAFKNQQEEIARIEQFVDRFRYKATKAKQVQSRIKMLEKMERIEIPQEADKIRLRIPDGPRSGRTVIEASGLSHQYGQKRVFQNVSFQIERGERIALVGQNGAGKTTLLKILAGVVKATEGEIRYGHNVHPAYYAQVVTDGMRLENTIYDEVAEHSVDQNQTQLRTLLGCFLFSGDDAYKRISVLSGGEKSRVALAKILLQKSNFLLLDEPTNHLDMNSKDILLDALQQYQGAILFIAHDRYFMDALAQKVFELKDGNLRIFLGNYAEYLQKVSTELLTEREAEREPEPAETTKQYYKSKEQKKQEALIRQEYSKWKKEVLEPLEKVEAAIASGEARLRELETILAQSDTYANKDQFQRTIEEYQELKSLLEKQYKVWEKLQARMHEKERFPLT